MVGLALVALVAGACGSSSRSGSGSGSTAAAPPATTAAIPQIGDETVAASSTSAAPEPTTDAPAGTSGSPDTAGETTAAPEEATTAEVALPQGGRVQAVMESDINTWDGTDYYGVAWMVDVVTCNTLVGYPTTADPVQALELRPELAEGYEVTEDGYRYAFTLREGLVFNDGSPVTGADVKGTFLRMLDPEGAFQAAGTTYYDVIDGAAAYKAGDADDISGITVDGNVVTFDLAARDGGFLNALALGFACIVPADAPHRKTNLPPPTTGPYQVTAHTQGRSLTIDRNPRWQDNVDAGLPVDPGTFNVDGWDVAIGVPPDAQVLQLKNGDVDLSFDLTCCLGAAAEALRADPATADRLFVQPTLSISYATIDTKAKPFDDPRVRRAANLAVDREAIVKLTGGELQAAPSSGIVPDTMLPPGTDAAIYPSTPDPEAAKALLAQAGVQTPLDAGTIYYTEGAVTDDIAQQVQSDLRAVGLRLKLKGLNSDTFFQFVADPKNEDTIALAGWEADYPDGIGIFEPLLTAGAANGGGNLGDFESRELDAEVFRIKALPPGVERREAWAELSARTAREQAPLIVFSTRNAVSLTSERLGGYAYGAGKSILLGLQYLEP